MHPHSANGQGHVTQSRTEMDLRQLHAAYDALLLDKMQVIDQKDVLYDEVVAARALIVLYEATIDRLQGQLDLLQRPESDAPPFLDGTSVTDNATATTEYPLPRYE